MSPSPGLTESLLRPLLRADPHRPRLTWYGGEPFGRTELSTASLANWAAKTAGLLVDELGVAPGGLVRVLGLRSWQLVPAALGSWWAGVTVDLGTSADRTATAGAAGFADAVFAGPDLPPDLVAGQLEEAEPDTYLALTTHPLALPVGDLPDGARDFSLAVRAHADRFPGVPVDPTGVAVRSDPPLGRWADDALTVAAAGQRARELAEGWGPQPRVLVELGATAGHSSELLALALAALSADGSLVVVDPAAGAVSAMVARDEQVTVTAPF